MYKKRSPTFITNFLPKTKSNNNINFNSESHRKTRSVLVNNLKRLSKNVNKKSLPTKLNLLNLRKIGLENKKKKRNKSEKQKQKKRISIKNLVLIKKVTIIDNNYIKNKMRPKKKFKKSIFSLKSQNILKEIKKKENVLKNLKNNLLKKSKFSTKLKNDYFKVIYEVEFFNLNNIMIKFNNQNKRLKRFSIINYKKNLDILKMNYFEERNIQKKIKSMRENYSNLVFK